jgi:hypothetical protein
MTPTATVHDNVKMSRIVVKVPASQIDFPYKGEVERAQQLTRAHKYLEDSQLAGMKLKVKEMK